MVQWFISHHALWCGERSTTLLYTFSVFQFYALQHTHTHAHTQKEREGTKVFCTVCNRVHYHHTMIIGVCSLVFSCLFSFIFRSHLFFVSKKISKEKNYWKKSILCSFVIMVVNTKSMCFFLSSSVCLPFLVIWFDELRLRDWPPFNRMIDWPPINSNNLLIFHSLIIICTILFPFFCFAYTHFWVTFLSHIFNRFVRIRITHTHTTSSTLMNGMIIDW